MDRLAPAGYAPALLAAGAAFFEVGELPEVVDDIEVADLNKPCADACGLLGNCSIWTVLAEIRFLDVRTFHDFPASLKTLLPVRLPLEQVARVQCV